MSAPGADVATFEEKWVEGWNTHDPDALAALCHPDITWEEPAPRRTLRGREEVRAWIAQNFVAFPDLHISVVRTFASPQGDALAARWILTGTHRGPLDPPGFAPTQLPVRVEGVDFMDFADGLLVGMRMIYDVSDLAVQLKLAPRPGGLMERTLVAMQRRAQTLKR